VGGENRWTGPWITTLDTLNRMATHSVLIFVLFLLSKGTEVGQKLLFPPDGLLVLKGTKYAIPATEVFLDFDFVLAVIFLLGLLAQVLRGTLRELFK
jgi:hypothetical protein